jgi:segregation and condensation protein A
MTTSHFVRLDQFEGPLDLLLHLVKVHELNIFDIDLHVLIVQYLEYLRLMQFRDLQDAAAFMEMAASLCGIKSRSLLPGGDTGLYPEEVTDDLNIKENLEQRLFDYQTFSQAGEYLGVRQGDLEGAYTGHAWRHLETIYEGCENPLRGDVSILLILYEQMLTTLPDRRPITVQAVTEAITVEEIIEKIASYIESLRFFWFQKLYSQFGTRYELVANILAVLQLVREGKAKVHQREWPSGALWVYAPQVDEATLPEEEDDIASPETLVTQEGP